MSESIKPTLGEWYVQEPNTDEDRNNGERPIYTWRIRTEYPARLGGVTGHEICEITHLNTGHEESDAKLFADAGNTFHATGKTPSQLAEQVKVLREALILAERDFVRDGHGGLFDPGEHSTADAVYAALAATEWGKK